MTNRDKQISRRKVIAGTGAATIGALAGCGGSGSSDDSQSVEVLHAWKSGDGAKALEALISGYSNSDRISPNVVKGAARSNLVSTIQNKLSTDPPSTWQAWPGKNLQRFPKNQYGDLEGDVWNSDLKENYLSGPKQQAQYDGKFVAVPLNIHRINNLFYNKNVLSEAGVDPTTLSSPSDLTGALETVKSETDATPFAHARAGWTTTQLWATVLLAQAGQSGYNDYINGNGSKSDVRSALQTTKEYLNYTFDDASSIGWTEGNSRFQNDEAAFIHQGDWAAGAYTGNSDFEYESDWGHIPFPGSEGNYALNMDSFPFPKKAPAKKATKEFLKYCGGTEAQIAFNKQKGSIPPRKDADVSKLNTFQQDQFDDFTGSDAQPPSIQHGLALVPPVKSSVGSAFASFISKENVDETATALMNAFN